MCRILTLNILAENFALPQFYPQGCDKYLATNYRWTKLKCFLENIRDSYDVLLFQEVTHHTIINNITYPGNYNLLQQILPDFEGMFVAHNVDHWLTDSNSYLQNGNATFIRRSLGSVVFHDLDLTTGNHCLLAQFNNYKILNIHLDSDNADKRCLELSGILQYLMDSDTTDIIAGDFNMNSIGNVLNMLTLSNFRVISPISIPTYAFGELMAIDTVLCRNGYCSSSNNSGEQLWQINLSDCQRLIICLELWGTDHIPVSVVVNKN